MITLDFSRINAQVLEQQTILNKMNAFLQDRETKLKKALPAIEAILVKRNITNATIGNMYSAGSSSFGNAYSEDISLIAHLEGRLAKPVKNVELFKNKLREDFAVFGGNIRIDYILVGPLSNKIAFQFFIK